MVPVVVAHGHATTAHWRILPMTLSVLLATFLETPDLVIINHFICGKMLNGIHVEDFISVVLHGLAP